MQKLHMYDMESTNISLKLADMMTKYIVGVLEDVLVRVAEFYVPVDFAAMEI